MLCHKRCLCDNRRNLREIVASLGVIGMSELQQSEESGIVFQEDAAPQTEDQTTELAPVSPDEGEENTKAEVEGIEVEGPEGFKKAINKQHFKMREQQRRADAAEKRLKELEDRQKPSVTVSDVPPMPDQFDDDFERRYKQREEILQRNAAAQALEINRKEQQAISQRDRERREFEESQKVQSQFKENATKLGVDQKALSQAARVVIEYGITPELEHSIMNDPDGSLILMHLAANPLELSDVIESDPITAGRLLERVKAKAGSLKPKPSLAPDPPSNLGGRSAPQKERGPKGAKYE